MKLINELDEKLRHKNAEYVNFLVEKQTNLNFYINGVMASARADVGLGGDLSALNAQTQEMGDRVRAALHQRNKVYEAEHREVFADEDDPGY